MRAAAYQRSELARDRSCGPGAPSIKSCGLEFDSRAKKKSGPWPAQAVPSLRSLASKVAVMAVCKAEPGDFASSMRDRKSVVEGKRVDLGGRRIIKKKKEREGEGGGG